MGNRVKKKNIDLINLSTLLMLLMFLSFFKNLNADSLNLIGDVFLSSSMLMILIVFIAFHSVFLKFDRKLLKAVLPLFLISLIYFLNTFFSINYLVSLKRSFLIFLIFLSIIFFYKVGLVDYKGLLKQRLLFFLTSIALFIVVSYFLSPQINNYKSFFLNPNVYGVYVTMLFLSLIVLNGGKYKEFIFLIGLFFVYISTSRTSLLAYSFAYIFMVFHSFFYSSRKVYISVIFVLVLISIFVIYFLTYLNLSDYNELIREYTGKNLLSGRDEVWPYVLQLSWQNPLFGWGGGLDLKDVSLYGFSSHNFYLETALQIGYIGVLLIYGFYYQLWSLIWSGRGGEGYIAGANALLIWLISIQNFEVTLLQNNLAMSVPILCLIAYVIGVNVAKNKMRI